MDNRASDENSNVKSLGSINSPVNDASSQIGNTVALDKVSVANSGKSAGTDATSNVSDVKQKDSKKISPIEEIRKATVSSGKDSYAVSVTDKAKTEEAPKEKDQIRIVIRDAKPPLAARALQAFMRLICLILIIAVCGIGIPRLFGINEFNVLTGSMTPTYPVGTLVFVQPKDPSTIRPGEVVTCIMNEDLDMVTHRVTSNNYEDKTLTTKGDANNSEDSPSLYENVVGVVCFSVPYAGGVVDYVTNDSQGRIVGIGIVLAILALTFIAEGICYLLTKQSANVYNTSGKKNYGVKRINAHQFNRKYKRGKGEAIPTSEQLKEKAAEEKKTQGSNKTASSQKK